MTFVNGLTLLLFFQLVGEGLSLFFNLPIPGPVLGMILALVSLFIAKHHQQALEDASSHLLSHLSLLFIPAGVGLITHAERLNAQWLPISLSIVLGSIITLLSTAVIMVMINRWVLKEK